MSVVLIERAAHGVAHVVMNRPEVFNAFDEAMIEQLDAAFKELNADPKVRIIILRGHGKHFSAGADLQWMQRAAAADQAWNVADARRFANMLARIESSPKPTVAQVQGVALGGGVGLVCACDMAVAAEHASFAVSEAKFGILPAVIGPYVVNAVGKRHAKRLALTTSRIGANEALQMGLVQQVVPLEQLQSTTEQWCQDLVVGGPQAQGEIKQLFAQLPQAPITAEIRELTAQTIARVRCGTEAKEGFEAFLSKRPPSWMAS